MILMHSYLNGVKIICKLLTYEKELSKSAGKNLDKYYTSNFYKLLNYGKKSNCIGKS